VEGNGPERGAGGTATARIVEDIQIAIGIPNIDFAIGYEWRGEGDIAAQNCFPDRCSIRSVDGKSVGLLGAT
jgi:hypothetical protein